MHKSQEITDPDRYLRSEAAAERHGPSCRALGSFERWTAQGDAALAAAGSALLGPLGAESGAEWKGMEGDGRGWLGRSGRTESDDVLKT